MSITKGTLPSIIQPVYSTAYVNYVSTNIFRPNYHYVFDVYVQEGNSSLTAFTTSNLGRYTLLPKFPLGNCQFSPNRIIETDLSYDLTQNVVSTVISTGCSRYYTIQVGEQSGSTITSGLTSYTGYTLNCSASYETLSSWNFQNYYTNYILTGTSSSFLTNQPQSVYIRDNERASISFMNINNLFVSGGTVTPTYIILNTYQTSGGSLTTLIPNTGNGSGKTTNANYLVNHFGCGIWNINQINPILINTDTMYAYDIKLASSILTPLSKTQTFKIDKRCSKYIPIRFMFLNQLGCFDYFTAILLSRQTINVSRTTFNKVLVPNYNVGDRGLTVYNIDAYESVTITSDWVTNEEAIWLKDLWLATEVYELQSDGTILPIIINNNSIEVKKMVNDKLINYQFDYRYAFYISTARN